MKNPGKNLPHEEIARCTCLKLRKATRRVTQIYDRLLEPAELTIAQFSLLAHLLGSRPLSIGELADALVTDPTTLNRNLKLLVDRDLVRIEQDGEDRRRRVVLLTESGRKLVPVAYPMWREAQNFVADLLGQTEIARLGKALDRALERLRGEL
jgi:DNA-binding MarR family transcriptional regulator